LKITKRDSLTVAEQVLSFLEKDETLTNVEADVGVFLSSGEHGYSLIVSEVDNPAGKDLTFFFAEQRSSDDVVVYEVDRVLGSGEPYPAEMFDKANYFTRSPKAAAEHISFRIKSYFITAGL
jgi:phage-related protein